MLAVCCLLDAKDPCTLEQSLFLCLFDYSVHMFIATTQQLYRNCIETAYTVNYAPRHQLVLRVLSKIQNIFWVNVELNCFGGYTLSHH